MLKKSLIGTCLTLTLAAGIPVAADSAKQLEFQLSATVPAPAFRAWIEPGEQTHTASEFDKNGVPVFRNLKVNLSGGNSDISVTLKAETPSVLLWPVGEARDWSMLIDLGVYIQETNQQVSFVAP
jgi:hypothetical protein